MGVLRTLPGRLAPLLANGWIELFRNVPLLVQLFLWYFVLPELLPRPAGHLAQAAARRRVLAPRWWASASTCPPASPCSSAPASARCRAGSGRPARAIGLTHGQTYRYVLLPVAFRIILPPLTTDMLATLKNTSVALTIGLAELTARARSMQEFSFQVFEAYAAATLAYCVINLAVTLAARWLERRLLIPGHAAS